MLVTRVGGRASVIIELDSIEQVKDDVEQLNKMFNMPVQVIRDTSGWQTTLEFINKGRSATMQGPTDDCACYTFVCGGHVHPRPFFLYGDATFTLDWSDDINGYRCSNIAFSIDRIFRTVPVGYTVHKKGILDEFVEDE